MSTQTTPPRRRPVAVALAAVVALALLLGSTGCTPEETSKQAIRQTFPASVVDKAMRVAYCESRYTPDAVSRSGDYGLFQINKVTWEKTVKGWGYTWDQMFDPYINSRVALKIYQLAGNSWQPWSCRGA